MTPLTKYWVRRNHFLVNRDPIRPQDYVQAYIAADVEAALKETRAFLALIGHAGALAPSEAEWLAITRGAPSLLDRLKGTL